ncbi:hypothetical protein ACQCVH_22215 [Bacillus infantis]|uniref:hypothetical protein n=1 Tax=Bacillus infantis TaxID=324767 RepID=UPI003CE9CEC6
MAIERYIRNQNGELGTLQKAFSGLTKDEQIATLGQQLALAKLKDIQREALLNSVGQQVSLLKIEVMQLKGGA